MRIPKSRKFLSVESGIWNSGVWNLWFNSRSPESCLQLESRIKVSSTSNPKGSTWMEFGSTLWNPESRTALDHLKRGKWSQWNSSCEVVSWWIKKCYRYLYKNSYLFFFFFSCSASEDCDECGDYVRHVFSIVTGSLAVISLLIVLFFQESKSTQKLNGEDSL